MDKLINEVEKKGLRKIAVENDESEKDLKDQLDDLGFSTIRDFTDTNTEEIDLNLNYHLDDMEKRKLQGLFGEKISIFIEGKIKRFLKQQFNDKWEIKKGIRVITDNETNMNSFFGLKPDENQKWKCSGKSIGHRGLENDEIRSKVQEKHFHTSKGLFEKFQQYQIPSIDNIYYALKKTGNTKSHDYRVYDHSKSSYDATGESLEVELEEIEDFKILGLEVKTSKDKAKNLLSTTQREVRDMAKETPFLDFYVCQVHYDVNSSRIPDTVDISLEKIAGK